jgi:hypothetical protein
MSDQTEAEQGLADAEPVIQPVDDADAGAAETTETQTADETSAQNAEAETAEPEKPKQTPWWQKRIDEVTKQKYEERQAREKIEAENKALRLLLEAGGTDPATATEAAPATLTQDDIDKRAAELVAVRTFNAEVRRSLRRRRQGSPRLRRRHQEPQHGRRHPRRQHRVPAGRARHRRARTGALRARQRP